MLEGDAWEAPADVVRSNRLNKSGESLLYATLKIEVAMEEIRLTEGAPAAIFSYRATRDIKVNMIGDRLEHESLSPQERTKLNLLCDFLRDEFTRDGGPENEHVYRISETIAKEWYDLPPGVVQDAWGYPSVISKPDSNVCFRPEIAHECLELVGAYAGIRRNDDFAIKLIATASDGKFQYHSLGTAEQQAVFPELQLSP